LSGRNEVWPLVVELINQKPILGWGGGVDLKNLTYFEYSTHNMYLQTALQIGYIGPILIFTFYYLFWMNLWKYRFCSNILGVNAIFLWLISIQNFEVTLLQNNLAMSVPAICLMAYIIGNSCYQKSS